MKDRSPDIYRIMDEAGLDASNFLNGKKSMSRIITEVRAKLLTGLIAYLKEREENNGNGI
jgi:hypothetical protein